MTIDKKPAKVPAGATLNPADGTFQPSGGLNTGHKPSDKPADNQPKPSNDSFGSRAGQGNRRHTGLVAAPHARRSVLDGTTLLAFSGSGRSGAARP